MKKEAITSTSGSLKSDVKGGIAASKISQGNGQGVAGIKQWGKAAGGSIPETNHG